MSQIPDHFMISFKSDANPEAAVVAGNARFTILTERMIRIEYSPIRNFENRASQPFWYRLQPVPEFSIQHNGPGVTLETKCLQLVYQGGDFSEDSLTITQKNNGVVWHFGDEELGNLGGTGRTLDGVDGAIVLEKGLISRDGWSVVDDSASLVFNQDCWLVDREAPANTLDLYFLGYGHDYLACLKEFSLITGSVPMLPRWALGNWWSRYWAYTQDELVGLMDDFAAHEVPLGVCIIDMDWHITQTGNQSSGWTGYSWNRELFPDPDGTLNALHERNLRVALNLHPAEGIHPHEEMYPEMARRMGVDPGKEKAVEFDIANPDFVNSYFEVLHHPQEQKGIDFWWMDWQQGTKSRMKGLDPLWWLNHLHFYDLGRGGKKRSFVFSRWGGHGNHRYPIGFSGDTIVSWASLAFQPYFTATAANVNYGWWSHDIGGHMRGVEDGELFARWVQYGAFSPILRLHSTKNKFQDRRPWGYDAVVEQVTRDAMQLRHALVPYIYSMGWRYRKDAVPPILPMYIDYPERDEAYACPNQYMFGSELIAAPFTSPRQSDTALSRQVAWLPDGNWFSFFDGQYYPDGWHGLYGDLMDIPVFAKAGAIIPLGPRPKVNGLPNPAQMDVFAFPGADGQFDLYEDDGDTNAYLNGAYVVTPLSQSWKGNELTFQIGPAKGDASLTVPSRTYSIHFRGVNRPDSARVEVNGKSHAVDWKYDEDTNTVALDGLEIRPEDQLVVHLSTQTNLMATSDRRLKACKAMLRAFKLPSGAKEWLDDELPAIIKTPALLAKYVVYLSENQLQALAETIFGAGVERIRSRGDELLIAWNNRENPTVTRVLSAIEPLKAWWEAGTLVPREGVLSKFESILIGEDVDKSQWSLSINLADLVRLKFGN
jgi:alpha-glucosidase (family GH31 glycosyl hydrolase)